MKRKINLKQKERNKNGWEKKGKRKQKRAEGGA
jgi:hypothetical protein